MFKRIVCLANSARDKGRCLAGIELNSNNEPLIKNNIKRWIRPVYDIENQQIPENIANKFSIFDIIEFEMFNNPENKSFRSEDTLFNKNSLKKIGKYNNVNLDILCENNYDEFVFLNKNNYLKEEELNQINKSLMLVT